MPNPASALGEAIGHLIEAEVQNIIRSVVKPFGYYVDTGGKRPGVRKGERLLLVNDTDNEYQIDTVIEDKDKKPLVLVECKYIRYKKHNRDKASWTCVAHYKLRTTYPSVRKSIAVLIGDWTAPSKKLMESFGVEIIEIPFGHLVQVLKEYGVNFRWAEKDSVSPAKSLKKFIKLSAKKRKEIAVKCVAYSKSEIKALVLRAINTKETDPRNVTQIELLLKTNQNEYFLKKFIDVPETINYLLKLTEQRPNVKDTLK